ncbi:fructose 1,6-bisphosphatase [Devosia geojensis]|uniref:Fructose-1,6-bisphosphatase class 1 n=1 Tax=Devosia geojensis TaxID=443610 RepID=A0A0F5FP03_9HYPH|nr:class 1 fructose-bisphosphatase [Devosia geojensis]KKB10614.1 fructose 1,6-bisphosphatase [Devosia geojensis]
MNSRTTLSAWLDQGAAHDPALASVVASIAAACAEIAVVLRTAPIEGLSGLAGAVNVQGEDQKQLDVVSNDLFIKHLGENPAISILVSEELNQALQFEREAGAGRYMVACDPLDGSSNLDVNVTVGSIFSVLAVPPGADDAALLQPGTRQLAAGYAAYGNSTSLVLTFGKSVAVFTLDAKGEFILTRDGIAIPAASAEYAINAARERFWDEATRAYVAESVAGETGAAGKRYNMRWVGSMVADIHRILMRGGIFLYPLDSETAAKGGRLRLMYEANPMSLLVEAAGGRATTGRGRILEVQPTGIHQRVAVILGSAEEVERVERHYAATLADAGE